MYKIVLFEIFFKSEKKFKNNIIVKVTRKKNQYT